MRALTRPYQTEICIMIAVGSVAHKQVFLKGLSGFDSTGLSRKTCSSGTTLSTPLFPGLNF